MIRVANTRTHKPDGTATVYVGRPSALGNPYAIGENATREQVIAGYETWLRERLASDTPQRREFERLLGLYRESGRLTLLCWCAPLSCHGDSIKRRLEEAARTGDRGR